MKVDKFWGICPGNDFFIFWFLLKVTRPWIRLMVLQKPGHFQKKSSNAVLLEKLRFGRYMEYEKLRYAKSYMIVIICVAWIFLRVLGTLLKVIEHRSDSLSSLFVNEWDIMYILHAALFWILCICYLENLQVVTKCYWYIRLLITYIRHLTRSW